jgi:uncharacterized protein (TIGR02996 family)
MSDEDALLAAIAAHPAEDTPRLVYADWLDEHGQPVRAEFIRVQVAIAQKDHLPRAILNRHVDLFKRNQELIDNHRAELLGPLAGLADGARVEFRRGFVEEVTLPVFAFIRHCDLLAAVRPAPRVALVGYVYYILGFLGFDVPPTITHRQLQLVTAIRTVPNDPKDTELSSGNPTTFDAQRWPRLEELDVSGCRLGDRNAVALLTPSSFPVLTDLDISANELTDLAVDALLDSGVLWRLKRLILGGNPITDAGAIALAQRWPTGDDDRLETLNLRFTNVGQPGHQALLRRFGGRVDLF